MGARKRSPVSQAGWLVFIDTNIFLDFYRARGSDSLAILEHLDGKYDRVITGSQVEMEFKKHRQAEIIAAYNAIKTPGFNELRSLPSFLSDSKQKSGIETSETQVEAMVTRLQQRTQRLLLKPSSHDPVYTQTQRLFRSDSPYNLSRDKKVRHRIRGRAVKRWRLGYPPRKKGDTSIGDAVNWEWIVQCAIESKKHVVVVSRDTDFGAMFGKEPIINDWLAEEFHDRVSKTRKIRLTNRLTKAFDRAGLRVTSKEKKEEEEFLVSSEKISRDLGDE
jgi:hypothetical protein